MLFAIKRRYRTPHAYILITFGFIIDFEFNFFLAFFVGSHETLANSVRNRSNDLMFTMKSGWKRGCWNTCSIYKQKKGEKNQSSIQHSLNFIKTQLKFSRQTPHGPPIEMNLCYVERKKHGKIMTKTHKMFYQKFRKESEIIFCE
jgi:hypothetical protein